MDAGMDKQNRLLIEGYPRFLHGGDYNPDQWLDQPEILNEDFRLLKLSGCNTLSVGIFAWAALEPEDGRFAFDWLETILDRIHQAGAKAVLATPSGSKPAWLAERYPEVRRVNREGRREPQWIRHNHCPTSPVYRERITRINAALAAAFGAHPAVLLWHLGNEYSGECFCDLCRESFRGWLRERYGSLDALNAAWVNAFWGHSFNAWSQVGPDDPTHDAQVLDWRRFMTHQHVGFLKTEIAAVRTASRLPVTTNMMGTFAGIDYFRLAEPLDLISNDSYPTYHDRRDPVANLQVASGTAFVHDLMRSLGGGKPFLQMECAPSATNWMEVHKLKRPGVHRLEMLQTIAHGADGTMYFQWRQSRSACEKFHGAVVDHVGHEATRVFRDVADHSALLEKLPAILGSRVASQAAVMLDWETRWALEASQGPGKDRAKPDKGYMDTVMACHQALWERGIATDIVERRSDFSRYSLLVLPMAYLMDRDTAERLKKYVANGGTVVASWLTGIVDESNRCHLGGWPGNGLGEMFGIWVEEWDQLYPDDPQRAVPTAAAKGLIEGAHALTGICDQVHARGATVLATYGDQFYAGNPVVTENRHGKGRAIYVGSNGGLALWRELLGNVARQLAIPTALPSPLPRP
jgi:beta-galactosidase